MTLSEVASLVSVCTPALSSSKAAAAFCSTISQACSKRFGDSNAAVCSAGGVIPAVVAAMSVHSAVSADVACKGCEALGTLALYHADNADAIVTSTSGLAAILSAMATHPEKGKVQGKACWALSNLASRVSPDGKVVMLESAAIELINAAKERHWEDDDVTPHVAWALRKLRW